MQPPPKEHQRVIQRVFKPLAHTQILANLSDDTLSRIETGAGLPR